MNTLQSFYSIWTWFVSHVPTSLWHLLGTAFIIAFTLVVQRIVSKPLDSYPVESDLQDTLGTLRARTVRRKNAIFACSALLLLGLWSSQITGFVLSIAALVGALIVVSKELVLCIWGYLLFNFNKTYHIGDFIEIGSLQGRIINVNLFTLELAEVGPSKKQTGRVLIVPLNRLINEDVKNLSGLGFIGLHLVEFNWPLSVDVLAAEKVALESALQACGKYLEVANSSFNALRRTRFLNLPNPEPEVFWGSPNSSNLKMTIRFCCPLTLRGTIEQQIVKGVLTRINEFNPKP